MFADPIAGFVIFIFLSIVWQISSVFSAFFYFCQIWLHLSLSAESNNKKTFSFQSLFCNFFFIAECLQMPYDNCLILKWEKVSIVLANINALMMQTTVGGYFSLLSEHLKSYNISSIAIFCCLSKFLIISRSFSMINAEIWLFVAKMQQNL